MSDADNVARLLDEAADLIEATGWTTGCYARDVEGQAVPMLSDDAASFCTTGAVSRVGAMSYDANVLREALAVVAKHVGYGIPTWNDNMPGLTAEAVVGTLRRVAKEVRS